MKNTKKKLCHTVFCKSHFLFINTLAAMTLLLSAMSCNGSNHIEAPKS